MAWEMSYSGHHLKPLRKYKMCVYQIHPWADSTMQEHAVQSI